MMGKVRRGVREKYVVVKELGIAAWAGGSTDGGVRSG